MVFCRQLSDYKVSLSLSEMRDYITFVASSIKTHYLNAHLCWIHFNIIKLRASRTLLHMTCTPVLQRDQTETMETLNDA